MPTIMPIRDLRKTSEIPEIAHKKQEPIFITKNGYSDLVIMSAELYDRIARVNRIDQAIFEAEQEAADSSLCLDAAEAFEKPDGQDKKRHPVIGYSVPVSSEQT